MSDETSLLDDYGAFGKGLQDALVQYNNRVEGYKRQISEGKEVMERQSAEIRELQDRLRQLKDELEAKNLDNMRRAEMETQERLRRAESDFRDKLSKVEDQATQEIRKHREMMMKLNETVDQQTRKIDSLTSANQDHERNINRLSSELQAAKDAGGTHHSQLVKLGEEHVKLKRSYDETCQQRDQLTERLRASDEMIRRVSSQLTSVFTPPPPQNQPLPDIARQITKLIADLRAQDSDAKKNEQNMKTALSSAANKILTLEKDAQTYQSAIADANNAVKSGLSTMDSKTIQKALSTPPRPSPFKPPTAVIGRDGLQLPPSTIEQSQLDQLAALSHIVGQAASLFSKSQKRSAQLMKLLVSKNEFIENLSRAFKQQCQQADALMKEMDETSSTFSAWRHEIGTQVPAEPLTKLLPSGKSKVTQPLANTFMPTSPYTEISAPVTTSARPATVSMLDVHTNNDSMYGGWEDATTALHQSSSLVSMGSFQDNTPVAPYNSDSPTLGGGGLSVESEYRFKANLGDN